MLDNVLGQLLSNCFSDDAAGRHGEVATGKVRSDAEVDAQRVVQNVDVAVVGNSRLHVS
jgi:hypothetical protein